jgi:hypothetical protein
MPASKDQAGTKRAASDEVGSQKDSKKTKSEVIINVLISLKDATGNITRLNAFKVKSWIDTVAKSKLKITPVQTKLKVECTTTQASELMKQTKFETHDIRVEREVVESFSRGIIHGVDRECCDDELVEGLEAHRDGQSDQMIKIVEVRRFKGVDGPLGTVVIKFKGSVLPSVVTFGYQRFRVHLYIPRPIRCFKCQRFGHTRENCRGRTRCATCGDAHGEVQCAVEAKCVNCGGPHSAAWKGCSWFQEAQEVVKVKTLSGGSYAEAVKTVKQKKIVAREVAGGVVQGAQVPKAPSVTVVEPMIGPQGLLEPMEVTAEENTDVASKYIDWSMFTGLLFKVMFVAAECKITKSRHHTLEKMVSVINEFMGSTVVDQEKVLEILNLNG